MILIAVDASRMTALLSINCMQTGLDVSIWFLYNHKKGNSILSLIAILVFRLSVYIEHYVLSLDISKSIFDHVEILTSIVLRSS